MQEMMMATKKTKRSLKTRRKRRKSPNATTMRMNGSSGKAHPWGPSETTAATAPTTTPAAVRGRGILYMLVI